jgi:hypothetical protein
LPAIDGALWQELDLDELVTVNRRRELGDEGLGDAVFANQHDRVEVVAEGPEVALLLAGE